LGKTNMFQTTNQVFTAVISLTTSGLMWVANEPNSNTSLLRRPFRTTTWEEWFDIQGSLITFPMDPSTFSDSVWIHRDCGRCYSSDKYMPSIKSYKIIPGFGRKTYTTLITKSLNQIKQTSAAQQQTRIPYKVILIVAPLMPALTMKFRSRKCQNWCPCNGMCNNLDLESLLCKMCKRYKSVI
jgi:hypothetical protein